MGPGSPTAGPRAGDRSGAGGPRVGARSGPGRLTLLVAVGLVVALSAVMLYALRASAGSRVEFPTAEDRAIAFGLLLDSPRPGETIDKALVVAEKLRQRYGIDTGNPRADRQAAAERARSELLDRLALTETEIGSMAAALGYSLEPNRCRNRCENIRRLAIVELEKRALERFADGG